MFKKFFHKICKSLHLVRRDEDELVLDLSKQKIDRIEADDDDEFFYTLFDIDSKNIVYVNNLSSTIVFLYLGENNLKYISEGTFDTLAQLEHLDLSNNKIVNVDCNL